MDRHGQQELSANDSVETVVDALLAAPGSRSAREAFAAVLCSVAASVRLGGNALDDDEQAGAVQLVWENVSRDGFRELGGSKPGSRRAFLATCLRREAIDSLPGHDVRHALLQHVRATLVAGLLPGGDFPEQLLFGKRFRRSEVAAAMNALFGEDRGHSTSPDAIASALIARYALLPSFTELGGEDGLEDFDPCLGVGATQLQALLHAEFAAEFRARFPGGPSRRQRAEQRAFAEEWGADAAWCLEALGE